MPFFKSGFTTMFDQCKVGFVPSDFITCSSYVHFICIYTPGVRIFQNKIYVFDNITSEVTVCFYTVGDCGGNGLVFAESPK